MDTWTFDLQTEDRPLFRVAIAGLYMVLSHGEQSENHPLIQQSPTLRWEIAGTKITIHFESSEDIDRLSSGIMGDFRDGVGIVPGYVNDPEQIGYYVTAKTHLGILALLFKGSTRGPRHSNSTNSPDKFTVSCATKTNGDPLTLSVTKHGLAASPLTVSEKGGNTKKKATPLADQTRSFLRVRHPIFNKWNDISSEGGAKDVFLMSFACAGHLFASYKDGMVGFGLDLPSFDDIQQAIYKWSLRAQRYGVLSIAGDVETASWVVASTTGLPLNRTYPVVSETGTFFFAPALIPENTHARLLDVLSASMESETANGLLKSMLYLPMCTREKKPYGSVHATLLYNLKWRRPWYADLGSVAEVPKFRSRCRETLLRIITLMETPMEQEVRRRMTQIYSRLAHQDGMDYDRARTFAIKRHLNRANTKETLYHAIVAICAKAQCGSFTQEQLDWIASEVDRTSASAVASLLKLGCVVLTPKQPATTRVSVDTDDTPVDVSDY